MSLIATFKSLFENLDFNFSKSGFFILIVFNLVLAGIPATEAATRDFRPQNDSEVIEILAPRTKIQSTNIVEAVSHAKIAIQSANELQDPRYLGRARAVLRPWWSNEKATEETLALQATIEQSLHLFADARKTLAMLQANHPANLQAWLTQASLDRLAGNYTAALRACEKAATSSLSSIAKVYGDICSADIQCHLSNTALSFRSLFNAIKRMRIGAEALSWGFSLLAECEERVGEPERAFDAYRTSLALRPDNYTAISYADALLRNSQPEKVIQVLVTLPKSDSVLLRWAHALRMTGSNQWKLLHSDLMQRFQESAMRGDAKYLHARELAYAALWLSDDPRQAAIQASVNIDNQKEVIDWVLLFTALEKANDTRTLKRYISLLQNTQLRDHRLIGWTARK
jgi:tetratricopeptide (TPR) repeat protein